MKSNNAENKWELLILLFLFIFSMVLRLLFLNAGLFHHDSVQLAMAVEGSVRDRAIHEIGGGRYGLVLANSIIFYFFKAFLHHNSAEFALNFSSALFGALSIPLVYLISSALIKSRFIAFSSAMLYSATPIFLSVSTFANSHSLSVFLVLLSFHFLIRSIVSNKNLSAAYSGIFIGASFLVRESNLLLLPAAFCLIFFYSKSLNGNISSIEKKKIMFFYIVPVIFGILLLLLLITPILGQQVKRNFGTFVFSQITYSLSGLQFTLTWLGAILLFAGAYELYKKDRKLLALLALWLIPLFLFYTFASVVDHRFFAELIIPLIILVAYSFNLIASFYKNAGYIALVLIFFLMLSSIYPLLKARHEGSSMKELSKLIGEKLEPNPAIMLYGDNQAFLKYYGNFTTIPCEPDLDMENSKEFVGVIYSSLLNGIPVYMSTECFSVGTLEEKQHFYNLMHYNFKFEYEFEYFFDNYHKGTVRQNLMKNYILRMLPYPDSNGKLLSEYMYYPG